MASGEGKAQMTESDAFLAQAKSDYSIFKRLLALPRSEVPGCHPLHYLQMATEKLAKAFFLRLDPKGFRPHSHATFDRLRNVAKRPRVAIALGWKEFPPYAAFLESSRPVFRELVDLHPGHGGPTNVEYPWPHAGDRGNATFCSPCNWNFREVDHLRTDRNYLQVLTFVERLLSRFHEAC